MIRNGEPFVPPTCPTEREGDKYTIDADEFSLYVDQRYIPGITLISGSFMKWDDEAMEHIENLISSPMITTDILEVPNDSETAIQAVEIARLGRNRQLGAIFCDRVENCRGVLENGECWALGKEAIKEVLRQATEQPDKPTGI